MRNQQIASWMGSLQVEGYRLLQPVQSLVPHGGRVLVAHVGIKDAAKVFLFAVELVETTLKALIVRTPLAGEPRSFSPLSVKWARGAIKPTTLSVSILSCSMPGTK